MAAHKISPEQKILFTQWAVLNREQLQGRTRRDVATMCDVVNDFHPNDYVIAQVAGQLGITLDVKPRGDGSEKPTAAKIAAQLEICRGDVRELVESQNAGKGALSLLAERVTMCETVQNGVSGLRDEIREIQERLRAIDATTLASASWRRMQPRAVDGNGQEDMP